MAGCENIHLRSYTPRHTPKHTYTHSHTYSRKRWRARSVLVGCTGVNQSKHNLHVRDITSATSAWNRASTRFGRLSHSRVTAGCVLSWWIKREGEANEGSGTKGSSHAETGLVPVPGFDSFILHIIPLQYQAWPLLTWVLGKMPCNSRTIVPARV